MLRYEDSSSGTGVTLQVGSNGAAGDDHGGSYLGFERFEVTGSSAPDSASLGSGADRFIGRQGNDTVSGGAGRDVLLGGGQDDVLMGGGGWDVLIGGNGADTLTGGAGVDRFRFGNDNGTVDRVTDFETGTDRILIRSEWLGLPDPGPATAIDPADFALGAATSTAGQFVFTDDGVDGLLSWDADGIGAGAPVDIVVLEGVLSMAHTDIFVL